DCEAAPWLVIRYRAQGYNRQAADYMLWLDDSRPGTDGVRLIAGDAILSDGQWHLQAVNLEQAGVVAPIEAMAVQCFADDGGKASLCIDYIAITDAPPTDAEGYAPVTARSGKS